MEQDCSILASYVNQHLHYYWFYYHLLNLVYKIWYIKLDYIFLQLILIEWNDFVFCFIMDLGMVFNVDRLVVIVFRLYG